ncbi:MAG: hypothetical protein ACP5JB_01835 [candidate division WOR-3 bacterium]|jgi:hypothetical protein
MKMSRLVRVFTTLVIIGNPGSIATANLLINGDFSNWENPNQPAGWIVEDTTKARIEQEAGTIHSTPYSCKITRLVTGTGNNYGLRQYVTVTPGTVYTFRAWFYDDDVNARGGLVVTWCRQDTSAIRSTAVIYTDSAIHTWQQLARSDTAPDSAVYARCLLRIYGFTGGPAGGVVYVDDAEFIAGAGGVNESAREPRPNRRLTVLPTGSGDEQSLAISLDFPSWTAIGIYDLTGAERQQLYSGKLAAGTYRFKLNSRHLPQGLFFVVGRFTDSAPLVAKFVVTR